MRSSAAMLVYGIGIVAALLGTGADSSKLSYRLPVAFKPYHYKLDVITHLDEPVDGFKFFGKVWIKMQCTENTDQIVLHTKNLTVHRDGIKLFELPPMLADGVTADTAVKPMPIELGKVEYQLDQDQMTLTTANKSMRAGSMYEVYIPFEGAITGGLLGYYRSSYYDAKTKKTTWLSITQFEPTYARRAFPCFDEPAMKAKFDISLGHRKGLNALSNMPIKSVTPMNEKAEFVWSHFDVTVPMSTYLVAYSINDFASRESTASTANGILFKTWVRPNAISQVDYSNTIGPKVLKFYEDIFDLKFPLPKLDQIAIPDFSAGAMENWGLVTYRETALLYEPNVSSSSSQHRVASVIAHELAHQWFGNLVTMTWWTDLWLNEGFATYVESLGVHHLHPEWNSLVEESVDRAQNIFKFDSLLSSHPVSVAIGDPSEISQIFDTISYQKGSSIIRMMHLYLGESTFRTGVSNYLKKHKYQNAEQDDLWQSLTAEAHKQGALPKDVTVKRIMDSWTLQTGYPIVTVTRDYENGTAEISQTRYLSDTQRRKDALANCWWVPLSYTTSKAIDFNATQPRTWLRCADDYEKSADGSTVIAGLPSADDWVIFNVQLAGLYKVKYDMANWDLLINTLTGAKFEQIHTINRAQLIDDALDLAWTGDQDYSVALRVVEYLRQEREYIPWKSALTNLNGVNRMLKRTSQYGLFTAYMRKVLAPIYEMLGGMEHGKLGSSRLDAVKHKVLVAAWSCKFKVGDCVAKSIAYFKQWMESKEPDTMNTVPLDLRSVVYCNAMRSGAEKEWTFLWQRYLNSNVGAEKTTILSALGCTRETWLLQRYLEWSLNGTSGVRKQDSQVVFSSIARGDVGFPIAMRFLIDNIADIYGYLQPDTSRLARYVRSLADQMTSYRELDMMRSFVETSKQYFTKASQGVKQSLEVIEINSQWSRNNYNGISQFLKTYA